MVVEDSPLIQERACERLARIAGVQVVGRADDVVGAIELVDTARPELVLLDLSLRDGGRGVDVLKHVLGRSLSIEVVVLTSDASEDAREACLRVGASAFFDKSLEFDQAFEHVAQRLRFSV